MSLFLFFYSYSSVSVLFPVFLLRPYTYWYLSVLILSRLCPYSYSSISFLIHTCLSLSFYLPVSLCPYTYQSLSVFIPTRLSLSLYLPVSLSPHTYPSLFVLTPTRHSSVSLNLPFSVLALYVSLCRYPDQSTPVSVTTCPSW